MLKFFTYCICFSVHITGNVHGHKALVAFLDVHKAFDTEGLFVNLHVSHFFRCPGISVYVATSSYCCLEHFLFSLFIFVRMLLVLSLFLNLFFVHGLLQEIFVRGYGASIMLFVVVL